MKGSVCSCGIKIKKNPHYSRLIILVEQISICIYYPSPTNTLATTYASIFGFNLANNKPVTDSDRLIRAIFVGNHLPNNY